MDRKNAAENPEADLHYLACQLLAQLTLDDLVAAGFGIPAWQETFDELRARARRRDIYDWRVR